MTITLMMERDVRLTALDKDLAGTAQAVALHLLPSVLFIAEMAE